MMNWIKSNSLWLIGFGLMLASSGLDGYFLTKWMPGDFWWLGLVLNTMADIATMVLTYWYGYFQQETNSQKREMSKLLMAGDYIAIGYSWLFSWQHLRPVMRAIVNEPLISQPIPFILDFLGIAIDGPEILAFIFAGFIPILLGVLGYAQSLQKVNAVIDKAMTEEIPDTHTVHGEAIVPLTEVYPTKKELIIALHADNGYSNAEIAKIAQCNPSYVWRVLKDMDKEVIQ